MYLADTPLRELAARAAEEGVGLIDYFNLVRSTVIQQLLLAASVNDRAATASLSGRAVDVLREIGRLTGEIQRIGNLTINNNTAVFLNSPAFAQLQEMLIGRLAGFPEALAAVVDGLHELEESQPTEPARAMLTLPAVGGMNVAA